MTHTTKALLSLACWGVVCIAMWQLPALNYIVATAAIIGIVFLEK